MYEQGSSTYGVEESERSAGVKLQRVRVSGLETFGFGNVALKSDGDGKSGGLVAGELGELDRLLCLLRRG